MPDLCGLQVICWCSSLDRFAKFLKKKNVFNFGRQKFFSYSHMDQQVNRYLEFTPLCNAPTGASHSVTVSNSNDKHYFLPLFNVILLVRSLLKYLSGCLRI